MAPVNGNIVLITGGGQGIGAALARRLHTLGAKLVLTVVADVRDLPAMDAEVAALGRSASAYTEGLEKPEAGSAARS